MPLAEWMREHTNAHPDFVAFMTSRAAADWVQTRYEQKGRAAGREPVYWCSDVRRQMSDNRW
jgi:hypothetical protein